MSYIPKTSDFNDDEENTNKESYKPSAADFADEGGNEERRDAAIRNEPGFKGLALETLLNLSNAMKSSVLFGKDLPKMYKEAKEAEKDRPLRPYLATASGLAEIAKGAINAPHDLAKFVARKKILPESLNESYSEGSDWIPHLPEDTGVASLFGLDDKQPEDRLYKGLANVLSVAAPKGASILKSPELNTATKIPKSLKPSQKLEATIAKEKSILDQSKKRLAKFQEGLKSHPEYRSAEPSTLKLSAADLEEKLKKEAPLSQIPQKEVPEIPKAPDVDKMKRVAKEDVIKASESLSKALGEGKKLHTEGGEELLNETATIRKAAGEKFEDTKKYFSQHKIKLDKTEEIGNLKQELNSLKSNYKEIPGYENDTPDIKALKSQLTNLEKSKDVKGTDVLDMYQTLHKLAKDAHDKIYQRGSNLNQIERTNLQALASKYEDLSEQVGNVLENIGDKNGLKMLKNAKSAWKDYASLYGNPTFQYLEKHKALHPSTISNLELGTRGNQTLNKIVANNPKLRQIIFGHKYATPTSHKAFLRPNEVHNKYLQELPEINDLVEAFRNASEIEKDVKGTASDLKSEHKELADSIKNIADEQEIRQNALENVNKYKSLIAKKNKAAMLVKKRMNKDISRGENIKELEADLKQIEFESAKFKKLLSKAAKIAYRYGGIKSALGH